MHTKLTRRVTATLSGPLIAAGIILGSMVIGEDATASAKADTMSNSQCADMTMTSGQNTVGPNALTRAGQVGAATSPAPSDGSMAVNCQPVGHG